MDDYRSYIKEQESEIVSEIETIMNLTGHTNRVDELLDQLQKKFNWSEDEVDAMMKNITS